MNAKRIVSALTLTLILSLVLAMPVLAIANPTSGPTIERIDIYRHCIEADDMLIVAQYYLDYDTNPDETINQAFLGRFMSTADVELANVAPYSYYDKGYDHGIFAMYLDASYVAHWGTTCSVEFVGNPTLEWPGDPPSTTGTTLNWHATTTAKATELLLGSNTISVANTLGDYWSIALTSETVSGTKLSSYGEQYFANTIPNLRTLCPAIFPGAIIAPEYTEEDYTQSYRDTLLSRWDGTGVGNALNALADWTTVPLVVLKALLWFIVVGIIAYYIAISVGDLRPALFLILLSLPLGNVIGMLSLTVTTVSALLCIVALGYALFYQKASG